MERMLLVAVAVGAFASPALASMCPALAAKADQALVAAVGLSEEARAAVAARIEEGKALHEAGDHAASEAALMGALATLTAAGR